MNQESLEVICVYEDQPIEQSFLDSIIHLPNKYHPNQLFSASSQEAAEGFIDLAVSASLLSIDSKTYYQNLATILFKIAVKKGFYSYLVNCLRDIDFETFHQEAIQARSLLGNLT